MLSEISKAISGRNKVILVHGNADMDAIGSAYAVSKCFPPADIYARRNGLCIKDGHRN